MCGRLFIKPEEVYRILDELGLPWMQAPEVNNQAPSEAVSFVYMDKGTPAMRPMRWGLHPHFAPKAPTHESRTHNARIESIEELSTFRDAIQRQRGFVPAAGFLEWKNEGKISEPFYFDCETQPLAIAGIWDVWDGKVFSFSVITQPADKHFGQIHPRMPLTLTSEQTRRWCNPTENAHSLLSEFYGHSLPLRFRPVSFDVNNARNKGPVEFVDCHPKQAALF